MYHETENPQETKNCLSMLTCAACLGRSGRYFTQSPQCWFSRGTALMHIKITDIDLNLLTDTKYDCYLSMYIRYKYISR